MTATLKMRPTLCNLMIPYSEGLFQLLGDQKLEILKNPLFIGHLLVNVKSLPEDAHLLKRPRKSLIVDFLGSVPRKLLRV